MATRGERKEFAADLLSPSSATQARGHIEKQTVRFDPLPILGPGKPQVYRVLVRAKSAGNYTFKAGLSSQKLSQPMLKEQNTEVTP